MYFVKITDIKVGHINTRLVLCSSARCQFPFPVGFTLHAEVFSLLSKKLSLDLRVESKLRGDHGDVNVNINSAHLTTTAKQEGKILSFFWIIHSI